MNKLTITVLATAATISFALTAAPDLSKLPPAAKKEGVTYAKDIRPIFETSCFRCHGEQRPKAGLKLTTLGDVLKGSREGKVVSPGNGSESKLVLAVARVDEHSAMPPSPRARRGGPGGPPSGGQSGDNKSAAQKEGGTAPSSNPPRESMGPPAKPLTTEQVALVRAWVDQGAK
jgi:mono/diheme cytochrome c family protein